MGRIELHPLTLLKQQMLQQGFTRLTQWWYFNKSERLILHVCSLNMNRIGLPSKFGILNKNGICDECREIAPSSIKMVVTLQDLKKDFDDG